MTVLIDYSMRLYLMVSHHNGVVKFLERGSAGSELIRRKNGEDEVIGVRSIPEEDADKLFSIAENLSGGDLVRCWTRENMWGVTPEAREVIQRVMRIDDTVAFLRERAARRQAHKHKWLDLARRRRSAPY